VGAGLVLAGFLLSMWLPWFYRWRLPLQIVGTALLVVGIYWKGGYSTEMEWRERVNALQAQIAVTEEKARTANAKIQTKVVTKIQKVKEHSVQIQEVIREREKIINKDCKVPKEAVDILNRAAEGAIATVEVGPGEAK
jgi:hypothetical protein